MDTPASETRASWLSLPTPPQPRAPRPSSRPEPHPACRRAPPADLERARALLWQHLHTRHGWVRSDPSTWRDHPGYADGLMESTAHCEAMWLIRSLPGVVAGFAAAYGTDEVVAAYDMMVSFSCPTPPRTFILCAAGLNTTLLLCLAVDQPADLLRRAVRAGARGHPLPARQARRADAPHPPQPGGLRGGGAHLLRHRAPVHPPPPPPAARCPRWP